MHFFRLARVAVALAMAGCAHAAAPPPSPAPSSGSTASATAAPPGGAVAVGGSRSADPRLDPSEEITADELASIPEPVPGAAGAAPPARRAASPPVEPAAGASPVAAPTTGSAAPSTAAPESAGPGAAWRVQIFASPDLAAADSVAKSASVLLEAPYAIEFEGALYKVRLGSFASEQEAQALRDRAVKSGFLGAFRVRSVTR